MPDTTSPKPGFKTTEFWLSLLATLLGFVMASGALDILGDNHWSAPVVGGLVAVLASLGYSASRAKVKSGGQG
jgi:hypothetical protein